MDEELEQDDEDFDSEEAELLDGDDESGDEIVFEDDEEPSEDEDEEEEEEPAPVVVNDRKRKRKSSVGTPAVPLAGLIAKKSKTVSFASPETDDVAAALPKRAEVKVGTSGKLKRKGGAEDGEDTSRQGKKAKRAELERLAAEALSNDVTPKSAKKERQVKPLAVKDKSNVKSKATATKATVPVVEKKTVKTVEKPNKAKKETKTTVSAADKPFDFNSL